MRILISAFLLALSAASASAQVSHFDTHTIYKSVQCEVGQFAYEIRKKKIDPSLLVAHVSWSGETQKINKGDIGASWNWPWGPAPSVDAAIQRSLDETLAAESDFRIHPDNRQACLKSKAPVHVKSCLLNNIDLFLNNQPAGLPPLASPGNFSCKTTSVANTKLSASGKFSVWVFSIGPSAEYDYSRTFTLTIAAPVKPSK